MEYSCQGRYYWPLCGDHLSYRDGGTDVGSTMFGGVDWSDDDTGIVYSYGSDYADGDVGIGGVQFGHTK